MYAKILIPFTDKVTGQTYTKDNVGNVIEITAERFNEITRKGRYIEAAEKPVKVEK